MPTIRLAELGGAPELPALILGPALGTSVQALWGTTAERLAGAYHVIGWDLPGHGNSPPPRGGFRVEDLAAALVDGLNRRVGARPILYAGISVGGAVGLELLLAVPSGCCRQR